LPIQYPDVAVWQRARLQGETLAGLLEYWKRQLAGAPARLELPTDRPRPPFPSWRGGQEELPLPAGTAAALRDLARRSASTPFILLAAALPAFFGRLTGQSDVVLGSPIAGRTRSEVEELIGFFVNTLVLRLSWDGDPAGRELLALARRVVLGAYAHQELPFEKVVAELTPERHLSHAPLFQVMFSWQEAEGETFELPGIEVTPATVRRDEARFDLELTARDEAGGGLALLWRYDGDLFDRTTVVRLGRGFEALLGGLLADPGRRLSALPLLDAAETHQLLVEWNDTGSGAPRDLTIPELFAGQVRARPQALAVVGPDERLTYGELDERAERLARRLRGLGVGPDVRVGLCLNRSLPAVVAILGILKAGGAYVPLDPAYPRERLAFMLKDAAAPVLLTLKEHVPALPAVPGRSLIVLDEPDLDPLSPWGEGRGEGHGIDSLAYVMYTSGSTGTPKGVAVSHRAVVRLVRGSGFTDLSAGATWLQLAPIAFDASTLEIWGSLLNGGRLVIFPGYTPGVEELGAFIERQEITSLWLTAGLFHPMVEGALESFRGVRHLLAGGDVLAPAQVERVLARFPELTLVNGYGPTENTTFTCCHPLRGPRCFAGSVPIGRPIADTRAVLLDRGFRPVPLGAAGELYAGGDGLARGYLDRPELTAERFVPDPAGAEPGGRLYRTGDLARHLADGRLEFLGRLDQQVKVRGFRIELGEVEAAVAAHPGVREAVVAARDDAPGSKRLAAYVVLEEAGGDVPAGLRDFLRERLPDYMVPSDFVALDALPLGPTGKVDRRSLPAPDAARRAPEETFVAPESPEEVALAAIWSEVLAVDRIGVKDDFFGLGGHSLLAAQVVSRVRRDFRVELPLRSLFQEPTIAGLLAAIDQARASGGPAYAPRIARVARTASLRPRPPAAGGGGP
jgi:aspartate racemase